ncbi:MAG: helix-turn-helix transcriptional regulator [Sulfuricaulis sp.]
MSSQQKVGFLRLPQVLELFPISKSAWWRGIKTGIYPKPVRLGERCTAWRASDISELLERVSNQNAEKESAECPAKPCAAAAKEANHAKA